MEGIVAEATQACNLAIAIVVFVWGVVYVVLRFFVKRLLSEFDRRVSSNESETTKNTIAIARLEEKAEKGKL